MPRLKNRIRTLVLRALWSAILKHRVRRGKENRARLGERYGQTSLPPEAREPFRHGLWIHGASVGEITAGLSLAHWMRAHDPGLPLVLTTTTRTGADCAASRLPPRAIHQMMPVDMPFCAEAFITTWAPRALVLVESEFWPHIIRHTAEAGIPCIALDAHLSPTSYARWRTVRNWPVNPFPLLDKVLVSSPRQAEYFQALGARQTSLIPPLKAANAPLPADPALVQLWQQATPHRLVWLAVSTHEGEEAFVEQVFRTLRHTHPTALLVWAPRHMDRIPALQARLARSGFATALFSRSEGPPPPGTDAVLVDTYGQLGLFFRLAPCAFVGGSLVPHVGGHNILEPLQAGCIPLHGPWMGHAPHVVDLCRAAGLDLTIHHPEEAATRILALAADPEALARARTSALAMVHQQRAALEAAFRDLHAALPAPSRPR